MTLSVNIKKVILLGKNDSKTILNDLYFNLPPGQIYTILGKNGSGKSTLIKSLTNLLDKNVFSIIGSVHFDNTNLLKLQEDDLQLIRKRFIRYVLQDLNNNFDPLKNFAYYFNLLKLKKEDLENFLADFLLPDYNKISSMHTYEISGGMAQRLSLMLALIANPKILILDEPTSAVDYINMNLIKLKLKQFTDKLNSVLLVTHDINFAKSVSDKIAFLQNGNLSGFFSPEEIFKTKREIQFGDFINSFYELQ